MKKILIASFSVWMVVSTLSAGSAYSMTVDATPAAASFRSEMHVEKKKNKGFKKRKTKKFLGIFKRKSACDCPKH
jgi:hypothetical protein